MGYADVRILNVSVGFESNTKNCKKNFLQDFWWANLHLGNTIPPKPVEVPPLPIIYPKPVNPIPSDDIKKTDPKPIEPVIDPKQDPVKEDEAEKEVVPETPVDDKQQDDKA